MEEEVCVNEKSNISYNIEFSVRNHIVDLDDF